MAEHDNDTDNRTRNLANAIEDLEQETLAEQARKEADDFTSIIPWVIEFRIVGTLDIIRSPINDSLIFGRLDERLGVRPDIDLSNYRGQQLGVSRRHARLIARDNRVVIEDLGSANGTYLNGQQLAAHYTKRISEGDIIQLGNLRLQVHFVVKPSVEEATIQGQDNMLPIPRVGRGERLLILDDNEDVCQVLRFVSTRAGFKPEIVHSLQQAISAIDGGEADALIVEVMLEDGSGLNLVQYIRQKNMKLPIVVMAHDSGGFREGQAMQKGADIFLAKPIAIDVLIQSLSRMAELIADA